MRVDRLLWLTASGIGTCTNRPCHRPTTISVRPAIAAWTAAWASRMQYTLSYGLAGTLRIA